ncbi:MAG: OmpA family protein [Verrucomicrobiae bacterium]|nr:OmpA family protein [Verrucomicrobiae bacterium]
MNTQNASLPPKKLIPFFFLALVLVLAGCASDDLTDSTGADSGPAPTWEDTNTLPTPEQTGLDPNGTDILSQLDLETFKPYNVQFDFDSSAIKPSERTKLEAVAKYMKEHADVSIYVLGNCDERGTLGYNRALGERRAAAARDYLIGLGIAGKRIGTLSFGSERPLDSAQNEAAWAKNRRDEFGIVKKKQP